MSGGGTYGTRNYTVKDLVDAKGRCTLTETVPFSVEEAKAAEAAGIDTLKVRFDANDPANAIAIRRAAPNTFMSFSVPLTAAATEAEAVRLGYTALDIGADGIMCQWSPSLIRAATEAGIPVQGHAGMVPRRSTFTGGLRPVGKTLEEALWVFKQIKEIEAAGAWAVEVELVPEELLTEISQRTKLVTSSIGSGSGGDIQFLFGEDILGNHPPPYPRHSKQYRNVYELQKQLQAERIGGFQDFIEDVRSGVFPAASNTVKAPTGVIQEFLEAVDNNV
jgi:3-methyl-2-oxobutanoate hydroxymethyltransferase